MYSFDFFLYMHLLSTCNNWTVGHLGYREDQLGILWPVGKSNSGRISKKKNQYGKEDDVQAVQDS